MGASCATCALWQKGVAPKAHSIRTPDPAGATGELSCFSATVPATKSMPLGVPEFLAEPCAPDHREAGRRTAVSCAKRHGLAGSGDASQPGPTGGEGGQSTESAEMVRTCFKSGMDHTRMAKSWPPTEYAKRRSTARSVMPPLWCSLATARGWKFRVFCQVRHSPPTSAVSRKVELTARRVTAVEWSSKDAMYPSSGLQTASLSAFSLLRPGSDSQLQTRTR
mmetsp:Transcript_59813/g.165414  ORF Transcript_59813/g.165414 Transcript_59813/m.165414 type:complete len:222 (-) Transcript_59813:184-849(-)